MNPIKNIQWYFTQRKLKNIYWDFDHQLFLYDYYHSRSEKELSYMIKKVGEPLPEPKFIVSMIDSMARTRLALHNLTAPFEKYERLHEIQNYTGVKQ